MLRQRRRAPKVLQEEGARAVGTLRLARPEAALAEQGRLLVARHARDRETVRQEVETTRHPKVARTGPHLGQNGSWHAEKAAQLAVPGGGRQVEKKGPRGIGDVGSVNTSTRQTPDQERIDRPRRQLAPFCPGPDG